MLLTLAENSLLPNTLQLQRHRMNELTMITRRTEWHQPREFETMPTLCQTNQVNIVIWFHSNAWRHEWSRTDKNGSLSANEWKLTLTLIGEAIRSGGECSKQSPSTFWRGAAATQVPLPSVRLGYGTIVTRPSDFQEKTLIKPPSFKILTNKSKMSTTLQANKIWTRHTHKVILVRITA